MSLRGLQVLAARVADLERRLANMHRHGSVAEVEGGLCRLNLGGTDDAPFLSPWVPYAQIAGALKIHTPPSMGQQLTLFSPSGDLLQGIAVPFTWTDANPSPSDATDQHVLTFGDLRAELTPAGLHISLGASEIVILHDAIVLKSTEVVTDGRTRLNKGVRAIVFRGALDSRGDVNAEGAEDVFV